MIGVATGLNGRADVEQTPRHEHPRRQCLRARSCTTDAPEIKIKINGDGAVL